MTWSSRLRLATADEIPLIVAIDDDASVSYAEVGLTLDLAPGHPFVAAEQSRWTEAARAQRLLLACTETGEPVGFASLDLADGRPYLDQLSVRRAWRRQGIGRMLIEQAQAWSAAAGELWLTTYDARVPWNQPLYERYGFARVDESSCGAELRAKLAAERAVLPAPEGRVAMVYRHRS
ncbi:MAG: GNAT family N-acetyltransferase [Vicinamibacterales bacterium]